jgi:hypothetical protein
VIADFRFSVSRDTGLDANLSVRVWILHPKHWFWQAAAEFAMQPHSVPAVQWMRVIVLAWVNRFLDLDMGHGLKLKLAFLRLRKDL